MRRSPECVTYQLDCKRIKSPDETESCRSSESHFSVASNGCLGSKCHFVRASLQLRRDKTLFRLRNCGPPSSVMHIALTIMRYALHLVKRIGEPQQCLTLLNDVE